MGQVMIRWNGRRSGCRSGHGSADIFRIQRRAHPALRRRATGQADTASASVGRVLAILASERIMADMNQHFGHDFSHVRLQSALCGR
jgi:hypothetical protein